MEKTSISIRCIFLFTSFLIVPYHLWLAQLANLFNGCSVFGILRLHVLIFEYFGCKGMVYNMLCILYIYIYIYIYIEREREREIYIYIYIYIYIERERERERLMILIPPLIKPIVLLISLINIVSFLGHARKCLFTML